jgi:RNA-binding protein
MATAVKTVSPIWNKSAPALDAAAVQHIGKLLVVFRPGIADLATVNAQKALKNRRSTATPRKTKRALQG